MSCPAVTSSNAFLIETLSHIDCQAQTIGSVGFQSLSTPSSPASILLTTLLTLFIALFGIRLLFSEDLGVEDAIGAILKIAIVLTLALSWPAYRVLAYDTVLYGPGELSARIAGISTPSAQDELAQRLQRIDDKIVALTALGTGRQTGSLERPQGDVASFRGIALGDETAFGWSRALYLGFIIGSLATLRIAAGLLLALGPIFAGLLLFDITRGLFAGWFRGLALTALGSLGISLLLTIQATIMEPWLASLVNRRTMGYATPSAPTELVALALGFAIAAIGLLALLSRVAFQNSWPFRAWSSSRTEHRGRPQYKPAFRSESQAFPTYSRVETLAQGLLTTSHAGSSSEGQNHRTPAPKRGDGHERILPAADNALGSSYRRNMHRNLPSQSRRDSQL
jgi:Type IV secretory pathway, VirB6 components